MRTKGVVTSFSKVSSDRANWTSLDGYLRDAQARDAAPAPLRPPPMTGVSVGTSVLPGESTAQLSARLSTTDIVQPFPLVALLLLHYLTAGLYTFFWTTGAHGRLPRMKSDDPSAAKAIGLCLVPFFNLYWVFVVYPRLAKRVNSVGEQYRLPAAVPLPLAYAMCVFILIPAAMATAGSVIMMILYFSPTPKTEVALLFFVLPNALTAINFLAIAPIYAALVQLGMNRIGNAQIVSLLRGNQNPR